MWTGLADILVGDIISVAGVFRDGTMDESRSHVVDNIQAWRVTADRGAALVPVLSSGEPDVESYWFGRSTGIATERGRVGIVSRPARLGPDCGPRTVEK